MDGPILAVSAAGMGLFLWGRAPGIGMGVNRSLATRSIEEGSLTPEGVRDDSVVKAGDDVVKAGTTV